MDSECVSCGACLQACPTATLQEKTVNHARPARAQSHHHLRVLRVLRRWLRLQGRDEGQPGRAHDAVEGRQRKANEGHSCVKGRFAWGYATHKDRITKPMIRAKITDPWQEVSWEVAVGHAAREFRRIQAKHGRDSIGGITSSRCTNEETYLVQKLVRARLRQQQRRHLRPRLPLAHRLRPRPDLRAPRPARRPSSRWSRAT